MQELELYKPMCQWLKQYISGRYRGYSVDVIDSHAKRLEHYLTLFGVNNSQAVGVDIQIDVLGIAKRGNDSKLFFIEAKATRLTLRDLGQLWAYCKLIDPEEAFLLSSAGLGSLNKMLNAHNREDLLDYGDGTRIKKMQVAQWNTITNSVDCNSLIPKM